MTSQAIIRRLGSDDNNNDFASTLVMPNADGSILERLEFLQAAQPRFAEKQHTSPLTTANIFTGAGAVEILALWGRVTTVIQAQATTVKTSVTNDALAAYDLGTTVDVNAAAVGSLLSLPAAAGSAHILTANGVLNPTQDSRIITDCTTSFAIKATYGAASTGAILWRCLWRPLSSGASLVAA